MANVKRYTTNNNVKLSDHFSSNEFRCHDGSSEILIDNDLIPVLERFRQYVEAPVGFNSAYRTPSYNKKVGGATHSYHIYGRAVDIPFKSSYKNLTSRDLMCSFFNTLGVKGIIRYGSFIHVDTRTSTYHASNTGVHLNYGKVNIPFRSTLRVGSKGVDVGIVQYKLKMLGYNVGNADMSFGEQTKNAVIAFQRNNGLSQDGIVGVNTWRRLF